LKFFSSYALRGHALAPKVVSANEEQKGNSKFKAKSDFGI
jgi:hypothetical protein